MQKRLGESDDEIKRIEADLNILTKNFIPQYHACRLYAS